MWPSGDRLPLQKQLDLERYPEYAKCGGKNFPGTKDDFFQMTQPLDCTYALLNGVYQPDIAVTGPLGTMQRWRLVQRCRRLRKADQKHLAEFVRVRKRFWKMEEPVQRGQKPFSTRCPCYPGSDGDNFGGLEREQFRVYYCPLRGRCPVGL